MISCKRMLDSRGATSIDSFIARWRNSSGAERGNCQLFLSELCDILGVPRPDAATGGVGDYRFERTVTHHFPDGSSTVGRIDLYRRGRFVLEAKQGAAPPQASLFAESEAQRRANIRRSPGWAKHMLYAHGQAENYARDLPAEEGYPPFLIVCDVGFCFDLYADFSGTGKHYAQFPDRERFRIYLDDLSDPAHRETLRKVWEEPHSLDPARKRVRVTRDIATLLARLAAALEDKGHPPPDVATFLMRCIFCMFAQSVGLLPARSFTALLEASCSSLPTSFIVNLADLWRTMDKGGYSAALHASVLKFNGGLFRAGVHGAAEPLPIDADMLSLLIQASARDWADVEPAIFGTLLENALSARERGQLGAHFTPRAFVERLVLPTVMEPLRRDWDGVKVAADQRAESDRAGAAALVREFHARLCQIRVLDPACGTGNFLYVTLELMKRLEGEVLDLLADLAPGEGDRFAISGASVDPHQFLGLEKNPRAVPVAELVLWIGYLQWHFRTHGNTPPAEPILRDFRNIREADALLAYTDETPERDKTGQPLSRWDGRTYKTHPITGGDVPDEAARELVLRPVNAKLATWPEADFIIGNPPFIAGKDMRAELGEGYAKALWAAYKDVPRSADIALFFWWKAAELTRSSTDGAPRRFGFITSNSIRQTFCRRVIAEALQGPRPLRLAFAIPDHPWADGKGAAAVRISMTVAERVPPRPQPARLLTVVAERAAKEGAPEVELLEAEGVINADLTIGARVAEVEPLRANERLCCPGVKLHGAGFIVSPATARTLGLGRVPGLEKHIRPYLNGRDLTQRSRGQMVIDLFGLTEAEVRRRFPEVWQLLRNTVWVHRNAIADTTKDAAQYARDWWLHGDCRNFRVWGRTMLLKESSHAATQTACAPG